MAKPPVLGKAKTRLAADIGAERALRVYERLLEHTLDQALASGASPRVFQAFPLEGYTGFDGFHPTLQQGEGLGARMAHAFQTVGAPALMIGTDCPGLTADNINTALQMLETHDVVIGPAEDGGYYLIGMRAFFPELLEGISWSTSEVCSQTLALAAQHERSVHLLDKHADIDTFADLESSGFARDIVQSVAL